MNAQSRRTSYFALTGGATDGGPEIDRVEVPRFQRDYAQGRESEAVDQIRADFLDVLLVALTSSDGGSIGLDFVYGGVDAGTLRPLDGQQRLTTLFLLHWYVASRAGHLDAGDGWTRFAYDTRQGARMFCESLVEHSLPDAIAEPSAWVTDQPWYLHLWRHDPTINSMLVMLDAIHERFGPTDAATMWGHLTDADDPSVWFLFLPLSGLSGDGQEMRPEDLYIKMNSRGRPLTAFENLKAHLEKTIEHSLRSADFAREVDTTWSDLLWHVRGDDDAIDDEFIRYLEFVTEICEWHDGNEVSSRRLEPRTQAVFGPANPRSEEHLGFLFAAFDAWVDRSIDDTFRDLFTTTADPEHAASKVRVFFRGDLGATEPLDLFEACCSSYGEGRGRTRVFSLGQTILLYAVLLHLMEDTAEFPRRLRIVRNLVEASINELRPDRMPKILVEVEGIIRSEDLDSVTTLNRAQRDDEILKLAFLHDHPALAPTLFALEDQSLLRGSLVAFELDAATFESRAATFHQLMDDTSQWDDLLAALLACGEYQRQRTGSRPFLFGSNSVRHGEAWERLLTGSGRDALIQTRKVLGTFLDRVADASTATPDTLAAITADYLDGCVAQHRCDWRYYMVRYPRMRANGSSTYVAEPRVGADESAMGYSLCMLKAGGRAMHGYYRDPYLLAIQHQLDDQDVLLDTKFTGYENEPRRLPLTRSRTTIRCVDAGFELRGPPPESDLFAAFAAACVDLGVKLDPDGNGLLSVEQVEVDGVLVDTEDRIQKAAEVVQQLVDAGL